MSGESNGVITMDKICLQGLTFYAKHGVYAEEKLHEQPFRVDLELSLDTREAAAHDDLALSVDYAKLYGQVRELVEHRSFALLETLAEQLAELALSAERVQAVRVRVEKSRASYRGQQFAAAVVIERRRE